jgi:hypothetical protein
MAGPGDVARIASITTNSMGAVTISIGAATIRSRARFIVINQIALGCHYLPKGSMPSPPRS